MSSVSDGRSDHPLGESGRGGAVDDAAPILARAGRESRRRRTSYLLETVQDRKIQ